MPSTDESPDEQAIRSHLDHVLQSRVFASSKRLSAFLKFVVESALTDRSGELKEYVIAVEVYDRKPDYDPQVNSTVRVEAGRLRNRLREYYESAGADQPVRIELPKGTYVPVFRSVLPSPAPPPVEVRTRRWVRPAIAAVVVLVASCALWFWQPRRSPAAASIAVRPFVNLGVDEDKRFCSGLTEGLTAILAKNSELNVASLGSDGKVNAVLEGSVRREGNRYVITTQLVQSRDGRRLWAETYDRTSVSALDLQQRLAEEVSLEVSNRLLDHAQPRIPVSPSSSEAMTDYLRANDLLRQDPRTTGWPSGIPPHFSEALKLLERSTEQEPGFSPGWSSLAHGLLLSADFDKPNEKLLLERAKKAARRALEIDPANAEAYMVLGTNALYNEWNFQAAELAFRRAVELDARNASTQREYADVLRITGRHDLARLELNRALLLTPSSAGLRAQNALHLYDQGKCDEAIKEADQALTLRPKYSMPYWLRGLCYEAKRDWTAAEREFKAALAIVRQDARALPALGHLYGVTNRQSEARQVIAELEKLRSAGKSTPYAIALVHVGLGQVDEAIRWLKIAVVEHDPSLPYMNVEQRLRPLRNDKRWAEIADRVGLRKL